MHEEEPDTERSCSDVSFRPCNTSWPDICKEKKKNPCEHTHKWLLSLKGTEQADVCQSVLSNYSFPVASTGRRLLCCCCFQISSGKNTNISLLSGCRMSQRRRVWAQVSGRKVRLDCTQVESAAMMRWVMVKYRICSNTSLNFEWIILSVIIALYEIVIITSSHDHTRPTDSTPHSQYLLWSV